ncbi:hypothetical protein [Nitratireductor thuwali]|uniref:hypothetical protein n=1 Tax=Nitratireductor thuwali TaxID=2267699 RepID=UPI0030D3AF24
MNVHIPHLFPMNMKGEPFVPVSKRMRHSARPSRANLRLHEGRGPSRHECQSNFRNSAGRPLAVRAEDWNDQAAGKNAEEAPMHGKLIQL